MAAQVSKLAPPAAQAAPDASTRERGFRTLRAELSIQTDASLSALLEHEIALLHEQRDDLAAAAKEELAATRSSLEFVEPIEALIDIATRSRSKANLQKLLGRLKKLAHTKDEHIRASLSLALTHLASEDAPAARISLEEGLEEAPNDAALWLCLEVVAGALSDQALLLKAARGRAENAESSQLRALLLERVARIQMKAGNPEAAYTSLDESFTVSPSFRALHAREYLASLAGDYDEAGRAACQVAKLLRQALVDSVVASDHQIPSDALSKERAFTAQMRAVAYALRAGETESARTLTEELLEESPSSAIAHALLIEIYRKEENYQGVLKTALSLKKCREWSDDDHVMLLGICALAAQGLGDEDQVTSILALMKECSPDSSLPKLQEWTIAEQADTVVPLFSFLEALAQEESGDDPTRFNLALSLLFISQGEEKKALELLVSASRRSLAEEKADAYVESALRSVAALRLGDTASYRSEVEFLAKELASSADSISLEAELLRLSLAEGEIPTTHGSFDDWSKYLLALLNGAGQSESEISDIASARDQLSESYDLPEKLVNALKALGLAQGGDPALLQKCWDASPSDPLFSAAFIAQLEKSASPLLNEVREKAAAASNDPLLKASWFLKSAFSYLDSGEAQLSYESMHAAEGNSGYTAQSLAPWFEHKKSQGDPTALLSLYCSENAISEEYRLVKAALLHRAERGRPFSWGTAPLNDAERLLQGLAAASQPRSDKPEDSPEFELFSPQQRAALALCRPFEPHQGDAFLKAAKNWSEISSSNAALITKWVAAKRADNPESVAKAVLRLGESLASDSLLASVRSSDLPTEDAQLHRQKLLDRYTTLMQDQVVVGDQELNAGPGADLAAIGWALLEESVDEISPEHAANATRLANVLDPELDDPDAQAALLVAGFEHLALARYEEALELFQRLLRVLPEDLTLCQGIRLAAQRAGRPDLEVAATCELARHAIDNIASAELWERAGVLHQEFLQSPKEAEVCFAAALSRSPGRPLSFERLYRFARTRSDRGRQIELIDARLDTAESERLRVELYWEKARFCRMLGRRTVAVNALSDLLKIDPEHLPALALSAELHLVDSRLEPAAKALRLIAEHPDAPNDERSNAGLYACELFEKLERPRDALELIQDLDKWELAGSDGLERMARSLARTEAWGEAYQAFSILNERQDDIEARLESARMMLAIQRDHIKDPEDQKIAACSVLRDAPEDPDAVEMVLNHHFPGEQRERLLSRPREQSRRALQEAPLNPPELKRFSRLCTRCGDDALERVSLGNLGLTGPLSSSDESRLEELRLCCPEQPSQSWSDADLDFVAAPGQLGKAGNYACLLAPFIAAEMDPTLEALGIKASMRLNENAESNLYSEVKSWATAFGCQDFDLYVGGNDAESIVILPEERPTLIIGDKISSPLTPLSRARLAAQLATSKRGVLSLLNYSPELVEHWLLAAESVAGKAIEMNAELDEMSRSLARRIPRDTLAELQILSDELEKDGVEVTEAYRSVALGAARAAVLAQGDASIVRRLPELMPDSEEQRALVLTDILKFVLSSEFFTMRKKAGLESA